jgi:hypothetical protein
VEIIELENEKLTGTLVALEGVWHNELCGVIFFFWKGFVFHSFD